MQDLTYVLKGVNDPMNKEYISHYECYLVAPVKNNIYTTNQGCLHKGGIYLACGTG